MVFHSFATKILVGVATIWHGFYFWKCTLTWIKIESKPPELRLMYFKKQDRGSYWSVPVWLSALFVKPHAKSVFNKLALNTDFSSSSSKLFYLGFLYYHISCDRSSITFPSENRTEHFPSRFSRRKQRAPRSTNELFFSISDWKTCSHSLGNTVGNLKELNILS